MPATRSIDYSSNRPVFEPVSSAGEAAVFGQTLGLVAVALAFTGLGAYIGRNLTGAVVIACFAGGLICMVATSRAARCSERLAIATLFAGGLLLGMGLAPGLRRYAQAEPQVVWHAAGATALFVAALGSAGHAVRRDLSSGYRTLLLLLLGLLGAGLMGLLLSMPHADVIYAVLGLGVFGGYTVVDFNLMRHAGVENTVPLATGIFLDVINVFLFILDLLGRGG